MKTKEKPIAIVDNLNNERVATKYKEENKPLVEKILDDIEIFFGKTGRSVAGVVIEDDISQAIYNFKKDMQGLKGEFATNLLIKKHFGDFESEKLVTNCPLGKAIDDFKEIKK